MNVKPFQLDPVTKKTLEEQRKFRRELGRCRDWLERISFRFSKPQAVWFYTRVPFGINAFYHPVTDESMVRLLRVVENWPQTIQSLTVEYPTTTETESPL